MPAKSNVAPTSNNTPWSISLCQHQAYALPVMGTTFVVGSLGIMQGIYAKEFGLGLTTIASILFIAHLFDAVTDPLIGYLSDSCRIRVGSRKPFVVIGGILFVISSYFLYAPVDIATLNAIDAGALAPVNVSATYFLTWFLALYFAWTLFEIPHLAWGSELANTSQEKTKVYTLRAAAGWLGMMLFYIIPLLPLFETNAFKPQTLYWAVLSTSCFMLPILYICVRVAPDGPESQVTINHDSRLIVSDLKALVKEVTANKPLRLLLIVVILFNISATGMWLTLLFIFVDTHLNLGERFAQLSLLGLSAGIPMMVVWYWLASRLGKTLTLGIGLSFSLMGIISTGFLSPDDVGFFHLALIFIFCFGMAGPAFNCLVPSILADIVDYGTWKFGKSRSGTYFSIYTFFSKSAIAIGSGLGLTIAGKFGFDPAASTQSLKSILGIQLAIAWVPAAMTLVAMIFILQHPMTARRHGIIRRRFDKLKDA